MHVHVYNIHIFIIYIYIYIYMYIIHIQRTNISTYSPLYLLLCFSKKLGGTGTGNFCMRNLKGASGDQRPDVHKDL